MDDELLEKALPVAELLIIKKDFNLLTKIATQMNPELQCSLRPLLLYFVMSRLAI
ncbi:MAG: hypothetical protein ACOYJC_05800 [Christensenellales bacterium]|jgi:hypothetical protein